MPAPQTVQTDAPGRVNLIGEHTDYNGGFVLPTAIPQRTRVRLTPLVRDLRVRVRSANAEPRDAEFVLGQEQPGAGWLDYVQGITWVLRDAGYAPGGFEAEISSDVPLGSGLSSSAALEISLLRAVRGAFGLELDDLRMALLGQRAENAFVAARVGIMDQLAATFGDTRTALFIDTRSLEFEHVPLPAEADLVVLHSGVSHVLRGASRGGAAAPGAVRSEDWHAHAEASATPGQSDPGSASSAERDASRATARSVESDPSRAVSAQNEPSGAASDQRNASYGASAERDDDGYNARRADCEHAAELLGVSQLRDLGVDDLPRLTALPGRLARRARHVITENARVLEAVAALRSGDVARLGQLFLASHASLRDDFEVSTPELDLLIELASADAEVYGARLTGGGFGGAVVILAHSGRGRAVGERLARTYATRSGRSPTLLVPQPTSLEG